jgi:hypothetical protein
MGRPIPERFFNGTGGAGSPGGEGVSSVIVENANLYSQGATLTFAASPIGGTTATGTVAFYTANGNVSGITITEAGSGYTSVPAVTLTKPGNVVVTATYWPNPGAADASPTTNQLSVSTTTGLFVGMVANVGYSAPHGAKITSIFTNNSNIILSGVSSGNVRSSPISFGDVGRGTFAGSPVVADADLLSVLIPAVTTANTIQGNAFITSGAGGRVCDILSQKGSRRYRVTNDQGTDTVRLVPTGINGNEDANNPTVAAVTAAGGPVAAGQMTIQASDSAGGTYWVGKLEGQTALVFPGGTGTPGTEFTANTHVIWTMNTAVASTSVKLATND